jgi:speckle-type POZ protein
MSSAASGSGKPSRSASTIVADNAAGYHGFKIDGYSRIQNLPKGESLKSSLFTVAGHCWHIVFFPNGNEDTAGVQLLRAGYASVYLFLVGRH